MATRVMNDIEYDNWLAVLAKVGLSDRRNETLTVEIAPGVSLTVQGNTIHSAD